MAHAMKKTMAVAVAAGMALAGSGLALVPAANAVTVVDAGQETEYSLTIHKRAGAVETGNDYDGSALESAPGQDAGAGFKFQVQAVGTVDPLPDNLNELTTVGQAYEGTTDTDGQVRFDNLPAGVYLVTELETPEDGNWVPGPPFLVSVPVTNQEGTGTINNVVVYPKNTQAGIEKQVFDATHHGQQAYEYLITSDIPAPATGTSLQKYSVVDNLDARVTAPGADAVEVRIGAAFDGGEVLINGNDYNVNVVEAAEGEPTHTITVEFTADGLTKLEGVRANGGKVFTQITAIAPKSEKVVTNDSQLIFNNGNGEGDITRDSNEVETRWGTLNIVKTGETNESRLEGATFELLECTDSDGDGTYEADGDALTVNGQTSWTTNEAGEITITGIHASDFADNAEQQPGDDNFAQYCVRETQAPVGFVANDALIPFLLVSETLTELPEGHEQRAYEYNMVVSNAPSDRFLPNTGGMGIGLLTLAGLLVIGGGAYAARRNSVA